MIADVEVWWVSATLRGCGRAFDDTIASIARGAMGSINQGEIMNQVIYLVGLVVVVIAILSFIGVM